MAVESSMKAYDPANVVLNLGGLTPYGYAPDTMINISKTENLVMPQQGILGSTVISRTHNTLGTLTMSLQQVSDFNKVLGAWEQSRDLGVNPVFFFPVIFKDPSSGLGISTYGWVETQPDYTNATESGTLDWVIGLQDARLKPFSEIDSIQQIQEAVTQ